MMGKRERNPHCANILLFPSKVHTHKDQHTYNICLMKIIVHLKVLFTYLESLYLTYERAWFEMSS